MHLQFRERGLNRKGKRRLVLLFVLFIILTILFYIILNHRQSQEVSEQSSPSLPVITQTAYGQTVNMLYGYTVKMDATYMRNSIFPIEDPTNVPLTIHTYGADISRVTYTVTSTDTKKRIASGSLDLKNSGEDTLTASINLGKKIETDTEYQMTLSAKVGDSKVYYYSRIINPEGFHEKECMEFAQTFHQTALSDQYMELETYMETDPASVDYNNLYHVTLKSDISQMGYGAFDGEVVGQPVISFTEINSDYTTLEITYQMQRGDRELYNLDEYFQIKYSENRMYMMDYERTMEQMVLKGQVSVEDNVLTVGLTNPDMNYLSNETGTIVAFVQSGELYQYNQNTGELRNIFTFIGKDKNDTRAILENHDIKILNIDETGTMDFVVYGYMNSGTHEGECGINLFHYDSTTGNSVEKSFVRTRYSYQVLKAAFADLLYMGNDNTFNIMVGGNLVEINLEDMSTTERMEGLGLNQYAASRSGRYLAYIKEQNSSKKLHILDIETGKTRTITADEGTTLRPLAFMDDDLVYGVVRDSDIATDAAGTKLYPMYQLNITDIKDLTILKTYEKAGYYISDIYEEGSSLALNRFTKDGDVYVDADDDTIKNASGGNNKTVNVGVSSDDITGYKTTMTLTAQSGDYPKLSAGSAGRVIQSSDHTIEVNTSKQENQYFVYLGSRVVLATDSLNKAIKRADTEMGLVVDNNQQYIWKRSRRAWYNAMSGFDVNAADTKSSASIQAVSALLSREDKKVNVTAAINDGYTPLTVLQKELNEASVLDLTGCDLKEVLYYVSIGNPVYAVNGDNSAVLITGYTATNVSLYNPITDSTSSVPIETAEAQFVAAGRVYVSYVD